MKFDPKKSPFWVNLVSILINALGATYLLNDGFGAQTSFEESLERFLPLKMGIAINFGTLILGNIGCEKRKKYGAVGTPVILHFESRKLRVEEK